MNTQFANHNKFWSKKDEATLQEYMRNSELSIRQISDAMGRTPMAVLLRVRILVGIDTRSSIENDSPFMKNRPWSEAEDRYLREKFLAGNSVSSLAAHFDRSNQAIISRIFKILTNDHDLNTVYMRIRRLRKLEPSVHTPKVEEPVEETVAPLPAPGYYRHFKGNYYYLVEVASHSETLEPMVVYRALYGERKLWVRPAAMWDEVVEKPEYNGPRFVAIAESEVPEESRLN